MIFRKKMFKKNNKHIVRNIKISIVLSLVIALVVFVDSTISKIIGPLAVKNAEELINTKINSVVASVIKNMNLSYSDLIYTKNGTNGITSLQANSTVINSFKSNLATEIDKELDSNKNLKTVVQLGTVINSSLLSNRGPEITVNFDLYCSSNIIVNSEFNSAGLNQTLHQIKLTVSTEFCLMIINDEYFDKINNDYIIAESVIVGETPTAYGGIYGLNSKKE